MRVPESEVATERMMMGVDTLIAERSAQRNCCYCISDILKPITSETLRFLSSAVVNWPASTPHWHLLVVVQAPAIINGFMVRYGSGNAGALM